MTQRTDVYEQRSARTPLQDAAVGIDATGASDADVARLLLRADRWGFSVIVGYRDESSLDSIRTVIEAGAILTDLTGATDVRSELIETARNAGFDHLLWHRDPSARIDFADGIGRLSSTEKFAISAPTQVDETENETVGVMVAIPAYNEADTIAEVASEVQEYADEVLVVDDGSDDDTREHARETGATVVSHESNRGYGAALKTAFTEANERGTDHLVVVDGDGQHDPSDVSKLVQAQRASGAELVIGNRFLTDSGSSVPLYRRFGLFVVNLLTNVGLGTVLRGTWVGDTQSGFRAYNRDAVESLAASDAIGDRMNASTDIIYHVHDRGYDVEEVGTTISYETDNANSQNPLRHGVVLVSNLLRLFERERPITLIGVPGFTVTLVGIGLMYVALLESLQTGTFSAGISLLAVFLALVGILACFSAIILHSIQVHLDD